jgi:GNAT superfamily N-acetyltransferase
MPEPTLTRLCPHVATRSFESGQAHLDLSLKQYAKAFQEGDETVIFVLVNDERQVVAHIVIFDLELAHPDKGMLRCFSIPAIAVAEELRGSRCAMRLVNHARRVFDLRQWAHLQAEASPRYDGFACYPWDERIAQLLTRRGFDPIPGEIWWFSEWRPDAAAPV